MTIPASIRPMIVMVGLVAVAAPTVPAAQRLTIPEMLSRGWTETVGTGGSGEAPTMPDVLAQADLIVRGIVGVPKTYLSDDQYEVLSEYPIQTPIVIYQSGVTTSRQPGVTPVTVTQRGGAITIGNLTFTQREFGFLPLQPGTEGLFIVKRVGDQYHFINMDLGAFRIAAGKLENLSARKSFAPEFNGLPVDQALSDIAAHVGAIRR